jgi:hypothetical protein
MFNVCKIYKYINKNKIINKKYNEYVYIYSNAKITLNNKIINIKCDNNLLKIYNDIIKKSNDYILNIFNDNIFENIKAYIADEKYITIITHDQMYKNEINLIENYENLQMTTLIKNSMTYNITTTNFIVNYMDVIDNKKYVNIMSNINPIIDNNFFDKLNMTILCDKQICKIFDIGVSNEKLNGRYIFIIDTYYYDEFCELFAYIIEQLQFNKQNPFICIYEFKNFKMRIFLYLNKNENENKKTIYIPLIDDYNNMNNKTTESNTNQILLDIINTQKKNINKNMDNLYLKKIKENIDIKINHELEQNEYFDSTHYMNDMLLFNIYEDFFITDKIYSFVICNTSLDEALLNYNNKKKLKIIDDIVSPQLLNAYKYNINNTSIEYLLYEKFCKLNIFITKMNKEQDISEKINYIISNVIFKIIKYKLIIVKYVKNEKNILENIVICNKTNDSNLLINLNNKIYSFKTDNEYTFSCKILDAFINKSNNDNNDHINILLYICDMYDEIKKIHNAYENEKIQNIVDIKNIYYAINNSDNFKEACLKLFNMHKNLFENLIDNGDELIILNKIDKYSFPLFFKSLQNNIYVQCISVLIKIINDYYDEKLINMCINHVNNEEYVKLIKNKNDIINQINNLHKNDIFNMSHNDILNILENIISSYLIQDNNTIINNYKYEIVENNTNEMIYYSFDESNNQYIQIYGENEILKINEDFINQYYNDKIISKYNMNFIYFKILVCKKNMIVTKSKYDYMYFIKNNIIDGYIEGNKLYANKNIFEQLGTYYSDIKMSHNIIILNEYNFYENMYIKFMNMCNFYNTNKENFFMTNDNYKILIKNMNLYNEKNITKNIKKYVKFVVNNNIFNENTYNKYIYFNNENIILLNYDNINDKEILNTTNLFNCS